MGEKKRQIDEGSDLIARFENPTQLSFSDWISAVIPAKIVLFQGKLKFNYT